MDIFLPANSKSVENISQDGFEVLLDKIYFTFNLWKAEHKFDTYGGKTILNYNGEPLFAELVILRMVEEQGFKGVWVDTYRNKYWQRLPSIGFPVEPDDKLKAMIDQIYTAKGGRRQGCLDIVAYRDDRFMFAELKRKGKDSIRRSQIEFIKAGLSVGLSMNSFMICEWDIALG